MIVSEPLPTMDTQQRSPTISLVGVGLFLTLAALPLGRWVAPGDEMVARLLREGVWWAIGASAIAWVLFLERLPLKSIGLRSLQFKGFAIGILASIVMMASVMLCYAVIFPAVGLRMNMAAVQSLTHVPMWLQTATVIRAGVVEEIIFRGLAIERLAALTGSRAMAAIVSGAAFIAVHISGWGYAQLIVVAFGTVIMTVLYLWRRDLGSNMIAHTLTDFVGFLLARLQGA